MKKLLAILILNALVFSLYSTKPIKKNLQADKTKKILLAHILHPMDPKAAKQHEEYCHAHASENTDWTTLEISFNGLPSICLSDFACQYTSGILFPGLYTNKDNEANKLNQERDIRIFKNLLHLSFNNKELVPHVKKALKNLQKAYEIKVDMHQIPLHTSWGDYLKNHKNSPHGLLLLKQNPTHKVKRLAVTSAKSSLKIALWKKLVCAGALTMVVYTLCKNRAVPKVGADSRAA